MIHRIRLGDVGVVDLARAHVLFKPRNRVVGIDIDRIVDLHLQNEVGSTAQIESQMNAIGNGREDPLARPILRNAEDAEQEDEQDYDDNCQLAREILIHDQNRSLVASLWSLALCLSQTTND